MPQDLVSLVERLRASWGTDWQGFLDSERIDHMKNAAGERYLEIPIAGVMTFDDNAKITRWADYWDIAKVTAAAAG